MLKQLIIGWLLCGVLSAGFDNAYFQRKYPFCNGRQDLGQALVGVPFGPVGLFITFLYTGFGEYGWSLSVNAKQEKCE